MRSNKYSIIIAISFTIFLFSMFQINLVISRTIEVKKIIEKLKNNDPEIRKRGISEFVDFKDKKQTLNSVEYYIPTFSDEDPEVRRISFIYIGDLFLKKNIIKVNNNYANYIKAYNPERINIDESYLNAVGKILPFLINGLSDKNIKIRSASARAIGRIGPSAYTTVSNLIKMLNDEEISVRVSVIVALANIGPKAKEANPYLLKLLNDKNKSIVEVVKNAIWYINKDELRK